MPSAVGPGNSSSVFQGTGRKGWPEPRPSPPESLKVRAGGDLRELLQQPLFCRWGNPSPHRGRPNGCLGRTWEEHACLLRPPHEHCVLLPRPTLLLGHTGCRQVTQRHPVPAGGCLLQILPALGRGGGWGGRVQGGMRTHGSFSSRTFWGRHLSWRVWKQLLRIEGLK